MVYKVEVPSSHTRKYTTVQCKCILQSITTDGYKLPIMNFTWKYHKDFHHFSKRSIIQHAKLQHSGHRPALGVWFYLS